MPDFLSFLPSWIQHVFAFLTGGGALKAWDTWMASSKQRAELSREMRNELKSMLDEERANRKAIEKRLDKVEARLDEERERRLEAERQNELLQKKLDLVIRLLNDMREAGGKERLSVDEITLLAMEDDPTSPNDQTTSDATAE